MISIRSRSTDVSLLATLFIIVAGLASFHAVPPQTPIGSRPLAGAFVLAAVDDPDPKFVGGEGAIPNQYVVSFEDGKSDDWIPVPVEPEPDLNASAVGIVPVFPPYPTNPIDQSLEDDWVNPVEYYTNPDAVATAQTICTLYGAALEEVYDEIGSFLATMSETQARAMSHDSRVLCVMADLPGESDAVQITPGFNEYGLNEWALDRIDQRDVPLSGTYTYTATGANVHVYVLDSGLRINHPEIAGRASLDYSALRGRSPIDWSGHGTAVASVIGGTRAGVAKNVYLHSVRVLNDTDGTFVSTCAKALNWVRKNHVAPAVANCSWGFRKRGSSWFGLERGTVPIEKAVKRLLGRGVAVVISAGNEGVPASTRSPATVNEAITVAASDIYDGRAFFNTGSSNYGGDVDLFAPGKNVFTARWRIENNQVFYDFRSWGGTSFAAPLVTGAVAKQLQTSPWMTPNSIQTWLLANGTSNRLNAASLPTSTPNLLLYTNQ